MVTAGEVLKTKRKSLGKTIQQISQETKIQERFLEYIEKNEFGEFDSDVFVSGFIKIYSDNLGLDTERVLALYRRGNGHIYKTTEKKKLQKRREFKTFFSPKKIIVSTIIIFLLGILSYIGYEIFLFQNPPTISISSPNNETSVSEQEITITGVTENSTLVLVSDKEITLTDIGSFSFEYVLDIGENNILIKTIKEKTNQEAFVNLLVTYTPKDEYDSEIEKENDKYILKLLIENDVAWIKLDIDGINKISQVLEPSEREYEITDRFELISGRPSNTKIYLNDELYELKADASNGTFKISCEILQTGPVCR